MLGLITIFQIKFFIKDQLNELVNLKNTIFQVNRMIQTKQNYINTIPEDSKQAWRSSK